MTLVEHAKRELELIGEDPEIVAHLVDVVAKFAEFGHSGGSAPFAIAYLEKLLRFEPLSPLTSRPEEWIDRSEMSGEPLWQSVRDFRAFSRDGGQTWHLLPENGNAPPSEPVTRYGLWRVDEEPAKTGWLTTDGGRVIVSEDPDELSHPFHFRTEVREFPPTITHAEWMSDADSGAPARRTMIRSGPEHYSEGVRLLAEAADRFGEGTRIYGEQRPSDPATALLTGRAHEHLLAALVASHAAAHHPDSIAWQQALGKEPS